MRVVLDTAILVRANPRASGPARALLLEMDRRRDILVGSELILKELDRVMRYARIIKRFGLSPDEVNEFVGDAMGVATILSAPVPPIRDPDDVHVIQAAICGKAEFLCTLDADFYEDAVLAFCADRGLTVLTDVGLLARLRR